MGLGTRSRRVWRTISTKPVLLSKKVAAFLCLSTPTVVSAFRCRARRQHRKRVSRRLTETSSSRSQNLALTVLHVVVPSSLDVRTPHCVSLFQEPSRLCSSISSQQKQARISCVFRQVKLLFESGSFRFSGFRFRVSGFGVKVSGFGFRGSGFGFQVSGFGFRG